MWCSDSGFSAQEDEDDGHPNLMWRTTIANGRPDLVHDWTQELDSYFSNQNANNQAFSFESTGVFFNAKKPRSCSRAMKAVGVMKAASCEEIFEFVMSMDGTRYEYASFLFFVFSECSLLYRNLVEDCRWSYGLFGPAAFVKYVIGVEMTLRVMLCYFILGSMRTVVHNQDMYELTWRMLNSIAALEEKQGDQIDLSRFFRAICDTMTVIMLVTAGNFLMEITSEFVASIFVMTKQRFPPILFKDTKRMDHVARRQGCAAQVASEKGLFSLIFNLQVPGSTHYSMVFYFVTRELITGSLLQWFVDGDDEFRNSRLKLIPSVPKGSWIVRQSDGSTPCLLGKAVDCNYIRGPKKFKQYLIENCMKRETSIQVLP
ncbi:hypothetical protein CUMW_249340 [Citrus unshiu]|uniref:Protein ENHANCED DISEASE RESISTANCE 2 C-terminal domain-containing protein n=1 Tax=Citrus unshiu TaxID=55188 RepID=A0A2H5QPH3_CITUN|nr:hypothetical protein CUMW_249340 [Citrus unshiu]